MILRTTIIIKRGDTTTNHVISEHVAPADLKVVEVEEQLPLIKHLLENLTGLTFDISVEIKGDIPGDDTHMEGVDDLKQS